MQKNNEMNEKTIFHIDMNAFFCSVACIKNPSLRGKAFAIGRENSQKGVLSTASYEARKYGIKSAMSQSDALKILPNLIIINSNFEDYKYYHKKFVNLIKEYTNIIAIASIDELYADMSECVINKNPVLLAKEIMERLLKEYKLPSSIGIAPTLFLAKMASDIKKPLGVTLIKKEGIEDILYDLDVSDIFGIGKKSYSRLKDLNINKIRDFMNLSNKDIIISSIGEKSYYHAYNSLLGNSTNDVDSYNRDSIKSISESTTYDVNKNEIEDIILELRRMTRSVVSKLNYDKYYTKTITITLRDSDFNTITRQKSLNEYTDDLIYINSIVLELIDEYYDDKKEYRLLGVGLSNLINKDDLKEEYNLFTYQNMDTRKNNIDKMMDDFNSKYGKNALYFGKYKK